MTCIMALNAQRTREVSVAWEAGGVTHGVSWTALACMRKHVQSLPGTSVGGAPGTCALHPNACLLPLPVRLYGRVRTPPTSCSRGRTACSMAWCTHQVRVVLGWEGGSVGGWIGGRVGRRVGRLCGGVSVGLGWEVGARP